MKLGYNEHSVITNIFLGKIGHFTNQINPVITNPGYNEQKWPVPSCWLKPSFAVSSYFEKKFRKINVEYIAKGKINK